MRDVLVAADVERFAVTGVASARRAETHHGIVNVDEVAHLRAVAEHLDLLVLERQPDEPAR